MFCLALGSEPQWKRLGELLLRGWFGVNFIASSLLLMVYKCDLFVYRDDSLMSQRVFMRTEQQTKCFAPLQKLMVRVAL